MSVGDISIDLVLNDDDFTIKVKNADRLLKQLTGPLERATKGTNKLAGGFRGAAKTLHDFSVTAAALKFTLMDLDGLFLSLPKAILRTTGEFERMQKLLEGLSQAKTPELRFDESEKSLNSIIELSRNAPFAIDGLSDTFVKLKVGGIDPLNGSMQSLVDSVARFGGDSETLKRAGVAIQQMGGKGVISMEELRQQLGEAVPDAMRLMADGMGMTMSELTNKVSKGIVESQSAMGKMFVMMKIRNGGAAEAMMKTWTGTLSRMSTEWQLLQREVGNAGFADEVKAQLQGLTSFMSSTDAKIWARELGMSLASLVKSLSEVSLWLRDNWNWIKNISTALATIYVGNKVRSAIVTPFQRMTEGYAEYIAGIKKLKLEEAAAASLRADNARQLVAQQRDAVRAIEQRVAAERSSMTLLQAQNMAQVQRANQYGLLAAQNLGSRSGAYKGLSKQWSADAARSASAIAMMGSNIAQNSAFLRAEREKLSAIEASSAAFDKQAAAAVNATGKISLMTKASKLLGNAWMLMGGWVGAVTAAVSLGVWAWQKWGGAAKDAITDAKEAAEGGVLSPDQLTKARDAMTKQQQKLQQAQSELASMNADPAAFLNSRHRGGAVYTPEEVKATHEEFNKAMKRLVDEISANQKTVAEVTKKFGEMHYDLGASEATQEMNRKLQSIDADTNGKIIEYQSAQEKKLKALQESGAKDDQIGKLREETAKGVLELARAGAAAGLSAAKSMLAAAEEAFDKMALAMVAALGEFIIKGTAVPPEVIAQYNEAKAGRDAARQGVINADNALKALLSNNSFLSGKGGGGRKSGAKREDPVLKAIEEANVAAETARERMDDLKSGVITLDRIRESVVAKIRGEIASGKYGKGKEKPALESANMQLLVEARMLQQRAEIVAQANKTIDDLMYDMQDQSFIAIRNLFDPGAAEDANTGLGKLVEQFETLTRRVNFSSEAVAELQQRFDALVPQQALNDLAGMGAELHKMTRELALSNMLPHERIDAEFKYNQDRLANRYQTLTAHAQRYVEDENRRNEILKKVNDEYVAYLKQNDRAYALAKRTQLDVMVDDWKDVYSRVGEMTADWATTFVDTMTELATTGKFQWREMLSSWLKELADTSFKVAFGDMLKGVFEGGKSGEVSGMSAGGLISMLLGGTDGKAGTRTGDDPVGEAASGVGIFGQAIRWAGEKLGIFTTQGVEATTASMTQGLIEKTISAAKEKGVQSTLDLSMIRLATSAEAASLALASIAAGGGGSGLGGLTSLASTALGMFGGGTAGFGVDFAAAGTAGMNQYGLTPNFFANGGVMTEFGALPLRKYANGGIANKPQVAIYGEGDMTEAYVPLPDGRSIPVTMTGGVNAGTNVAAPVSISISVTNGTEGQANASGDSAGKWQAAANEMKAIALRTIAEQTRPGGQIYKATKK